MVKEIPLSQGKVALVDDEDFESISQFKWYANFVHGHWYAKRRDGRKTCQMHRLILSATNSQCVDHIDGNGLNNTRINLRIATSQQNTWNQRPTGRSISGFKGVFWRKNRGHFFASIAADRVYHYLGSFSCPVEAAKAYDEAAKRLHGDFACLNFPSD